MITRLYGSAEKLVNPNHILVIQGANSVGKTTILNQIIETLKLRTRFEHGNNIQLQQIFKEGNPFRIRSITEGYELFTIDDAHILPEIGYGLRILLRERPDIRIVITSSFNMRLNIQEPLPQPNTVLTIFPFSESELEHVQKQPEFSEKLEERMIYGFYPEVNAVSDNLAKRTVLRKIVGSNLLEDTFIRYKIKDPEHILNLLRILAFRIGTDISYGEIAGKLAVDRKTIEKYIGLCEQAFIICGVKGFSKKKTGEIIKSRKYYFYDTGIRNGIIEQFNSLMLRDDTDRLWENYVIAERIKLQEYGNSSSKNYFWRSWNGKEIDWIEEKDGQLFAYELRYQNSAIPVPKEFLRAYPLAVFKLIHKDNYKGFLK